MMLNDANRRALQKAFIFALSMMLFYWLALWMDWDLPKYGGLAIILVSLDTLPASFKKAFLRMIGTTFGLMVGLLILAIAPQSRWFIMLFFAFYAVFIAYFMQQSRSSYAWYVAGFIPIIVWSTSYMDVDSAFHYAIFRYLETSAGILIYMFVSMTFSPSYTAWSSNEGDQDKQLVAKTIGWDPYCFLKALLPAISFIMAYLFWIYVDPPTGPNVPMITMILHLALFLTPVNPLILLVTFLVSLSIVVAPVYFIIMPWLSTGFGLLSLIFCYSFIFCYLGKISPMLKTAPLILFVMLTNISNQQSYSFLGLVNAGIMIFLGLVIIAIVESLLNPMINKRSSIK